MFDLGAWLSSGGGFSEIECPNRGQASAKPPAPSVPASVSTFQANAGTNEVREPCLPPTLPKRKWQPRLVVIPLYL
jgi:hypothetical protein